MDNLTKIFMSEKSRKYRGLYAENVSPLSKYKDSYQKRNYVLQHSVVISKFYNSDAMSKVCLMQCLICSSYHWSWKFSLSFRDCSVFWEHQCHDFLKTRKLQLITDFMKFLKFNPFAIVRMIFQVTHRKFIFLKFDWFNLTLDLTLISLTILILRIASLLF